MPYPELWGGKLTENGKFLPKWQEIENPIDLERLVTVTCSCIKPKCSSCQSSRLEIGCITFCKCQRQCQCIYVMMEKHTVLHLLGMRCFRCYLTLFSIFFKYYNNIFTSSFEFSVHTLNKYVKFGFLMYYFLFSKLFDELIRNCRLPVLKVFFWQKLYYMA